MNVRSVYYHFDEIQILVGTFKRLPVAICLTETWEKPNDSPASLLLENYQEPLHLSSVNKSSGVIVYVHDNFVAKRIPRKTTTENITLQLSNASSKFILSCIYNAPAIGVKTFMNDINALLTSFIEYTEIICVVGDMNIDLLKDSPEHKQYLSIVNENGFRQLITEPTRITDKSQTLIDHILVKKCDEDFIRCGVIKCAITDHCATYMELPLSSNERNDRPRRDMRFIHSEHKMRAFSHRIRTVFSVFWGIDLTDVSKLCSQLITGLNEVIDEFATSTQPVKKKSSPPWFNNYLRNLITKRKKFYTEFTKDRSTETHNRFRLYRTKVHKAIKREKNLYYNKLFENCLKDKRAFFRNLNKVTGRSQHYSVKKLVIKDQEYTKPDDIAEKFNDHFANVGELINSQIQTDSFQFSEPESNFSMFLKPVTVIEIEKIIQDLKSYKSVGLDGIPGEIIKFCSRDLAPLLTNLINLSFSEGCFPNCLKSAKVIPVHKGEDKTDMNNYRPISLLSVISKVFERAMFSRISEFLENNKLLCQSQFGFRTKRSAVDAVAHIIERIRNNHFKTQYTCIYLDLKKAFDTIEHSRLLRKVCNIGIRGKALTWLESFLEGRTQCVSVNECISGLQSVKYGVPQGSILGPLLFIIYINDLESVCNIVQPTFFADDTNLLIPLEKPLTNESEIINELQLIDGWLKANKLALNLDKTHCMPFKKKNRHHEFVIGTESIQVSDSVKYLGIWVDRNLKFGEHAQYLIKKLGKHLGIVSRLRHFVSKNVLFKYYNFYVKPVLQYGLLVYGGNSFSNLDQLSVFQRKFIRLCLFKKPTANVEQDFIDNNILTITQLYFYDLIKFSLRSVRCELPSHLLNNLYTRNNIRETRRHTASKYVVPVGKNNWDKFSLRSRGTKLLNFLIDQGLLDQSLWSMSEHQLDKEIHKFKDYIKLVPDCSLRSVLE